MIITFILLFVSIIFGQFLSTLVSDDKEYKLLNIISLISVFIIFIISGYFTYNPNESFLFWDPEHETYERVFK